jgi:hypothetical protein
MRDVRFKLELLSWTSLPKESQVIGSLSPDNPAYLKLMQALKNRRELELSKLNIPLESESGSNEDWPRKYINCRQGNRRHMAETNSFVPLIFIISCVVGMVVLIAIALIAWSKQNGRSNNGSRNNSIFSSYSSGYCGHGNIENLDTMDIPRSGFSALERRAEYMRRGLSPSGFINGVYNDQNRPSGVSYYDGNRDWDADA